jgi:hypothetical protein
LRGAAVESPSALFATPVPLCAYAPRCERATEAAYIGWKRDDYANGIGEPDERRGERERKRRRRASAGGAQAAGRGLKSLVPLRYRLV